MRLSEQQQIFTQNVAKLINWIFNQGYGCTLGEVYRTKEQAEIYAKQKIGSVDSLHCQRLAIDINIFSGNDYLKMSPFYAEAGKYWKSLHPQNRWGGDFRDDNGNLIHDDNHYEMKPI